MKTNDNDTTPQPKWHGHELNITKLQIEHKQITQYKKNKTNNKH